MTLKPRLPGLRMASRLGGMWHNYTGWERKVHVTPCINLYSGQISVPNMSVKFKIVYVF